MELVVWKRQHKPWCLQGLCMLTITIPQGTLLTSARGEHDGPADIILVVHVAFD